MMQLLGSARVSRAGFGVSPTIFKVRDPKLSGSPAPGRMRYPGRSRYRHAIVGG